MLSSAMSAPATNAFSPAPVRIAARQHRRAAGLAHGDGHVGEVETHAFRGQAIDAVAVGSVDVAAALGTLDVDQRWHAHHPNHYFPGW